MTGKYIYISGWFTKCPFSLPKLTAHFDLNHHILISKWYEIRVPIYYLSLASLTVFVDVKHRVYLLTASLFAAWAARAQHSVCWSLPKEHRQICKFLCEILLWVRMSVERQKQAAADWSIANKNEDLCALSPFLLTPASLWITRPTLVSLVCMTHLSLTLDRMDPPWPHFGMHDPSQLHFGLHDPPQPYFGSHDLSQPRFGLHDPPQPYVGSHDPSQPRFGLHDPPQHYFGSHDPAQPCFGLHDPSQPHFGSHDPPWPSPLTLVHAEWLSILALLVWIVYSLSLVGDSGHHTWLRHSMQPQEQCYPFLSVCAGFSCVQTMAWLPAFGIFNVRRRWCMRSHMGAVRTS